MNTTLKTVLITLTVVVIAGGLFFTGQMYGAWRTNSGFGFGQMPMMGGGGWNNGNNYGPMTRQGSGPMMGSGFQPANIKPLTIEEAQQAAQKYLDSLNRSDLKISEVMIFDNNAYILVTEEKTGIGAFELLVDPVSKLAYPEHGPNMMWNLKYNGTNHQNMMSAMMGQNFLAATSVDVSTSMTVTEAQAIQDAQKYLDQYVPGSTAEDHGTAFYGYYTIDFTKDGKIAGMLSVNGFTGQVFLHTWHGIFIEEADIQ